MATKLIIVIHAIRLKTKLLEFVPISFLSFINLSITKKIKGRMSVLSACDAVNMKIMGRFGNNTKNALTKRQKPIIE